MVTIKFLPEDQAVLCIENGEFGKTITNSNRHVAIILTQSWCQEWALMRQEIEQLDEKDIDVWVFIYDMSNIYETFLEFKEDIFGNYEIPYVRYYIDGRLVGVSNYVSALQFLEFVTRN